MTEETKPEFTLTDADFPIPVCECCSRLFIQGLWRTAPPCFSLDASKVVMHECAPCRMVVIVDAGEHHSTIDRETEILNN